MYICICNAITENQLQKLVDTKTTFKEIYLQYNFKNNCRKCIKEINDKIKNVK
ncbi:bacterioferritin-associated ferredoxin [Flavobacterium sp.]|uniref:(2Fe-2S)-binding protein n=1 Tax=Flavobacterium sp. TaxID=239 RepID=UPI00345CC7DD